MPKLTFEQWKAKVDAIIADRVGGLTTEDLPDCPYWDWWNDGMTPAGAASKAIKNARNY